MERAGTGVYHNSVLNLYSMFCVLQGVEWRGVLNTLGVSAHNSGQHCTR